MHQLGGKNLITDNLNGKGQTLIGLYVIGRHIMERMSKDVKSLML